MQELYQISITLKSLRTQLGLTQKQVADEIGIRYQSYQAYEQGLTLPNLKNFIKLADFFEVSLDYLIGKSLL